MAVEEFPAARTLRERAAIADLVLGVELEAQENGDPAIRWLICNAYPVFDAQAPCTRRWCTSPIGPPWKLRWKQKKYRNVLISDKVYCVDYYRYELKIPIQRA